MASKVSPAERQAVYERDKWQCMMPECVCPFGRDIDPGLRRDSQWSATVDHVKPRSRGGTNRRKNLRAAHKKCNNTAQPAPPRVQRETVRSAGPGLSYRIGDLFPGDQGSAWS